MKTRAIGVALLSIGAVLASGGSARASYVTFSGVDANPSGANIRIAHPISDNAAAAFLSNLTGVTTQDFDTLTTGFYHSLPLSFTGPGATTITATLTSTTGVYIDSQPTGTSSSGQYPISGDQYLEANGDDFTIDFSSAIAAFGFYGVDIGDVGGQLTLHLSDGSNTVLTVPEASGIEANASVLYFGFYTTDPSQAITSISFDNSGSGDVFAFDNMTIGALQQVTPTAAPEPASLTMLGMGIAGMAGYGWRRRKVAKGA